VSLVFVLLSFSFLRGFKGRRSGGAGWYMIAA
jgi:hypothetical protein